MLLILTIGTGTAGAQSNVQQGIVNTINHCSPRLFWLIPSTAGDSIAGAEIIKDSVVNPHAFQPWAPDRPFLCVEDPDDLPGCQRTFAQVIAAARSQLQAGEQLVVNPTGGTKQMSAAATLAALEAQVHALNFIGGPRQQGVVITHQERVITLPTAPFYARRALADASTLLSAGSATAAAQLLDPWESVDPDCAALRAASTMLAQWQRLSYEQARQAAARCPHPAAAPLRQHFTTLAATKVESFAIVADLIDSVDALLHWHFPEEALARLYRATELSARAILAADYHLHPPYPTHEVLDILPLRNRDYHRARSRDDTLQLGLRDAWDILDALGHPEAAICRPNHPFRATIDSRNAGIYGHGRQPAEHRTVAHARDTLVATLAAHRRIPTRPDHRRTTTIAALTP